MSVPSLKGYNLVLINIDTLRADHLHSYGYPRNTSPVLDRLAREGVMFTRAMANSSYTRESVAALFSGRLPSRSGSVGWKALPAEDTANLAELFQAAGYRTGFFGNTTMLTDARFTRGFQEVQQLTTIWGLSGAGPKLSARAIEFVRANAGQKFMMYLHYLDPHGPYDPPKDLYLRFATSVFPHPVNVYTDVRLNVASLVHDGFGPGEARFDDMVLRYDAEIADTDRSIGMVLQDLEASHLLQRTVVVITADHGEEFLEHGFVEHAWTLYDESLHIPLIVWVPGVPLQRRIDAPVSIVDVLPTLLQLLEVPHVRRDFDGSALLERDGASLNFRAPPLPIIAELLITQRSALRAVTDGRWKYIGAQRWLPPEERPAAIKLQDPERDPASQSEPSIWGPIVHEELYNLTDDPQEQRDVLRSAPLEHQRLRQQLMSYVSRCRENGSVRETNPTLSPADAERLKSLGYVSD